MPNTIPLREWLRHINAEYLSTFVKDGGSSVKFAVTPDELKPDLDAALRDRCRELDYLFVKLDAAEIRAHMPQDIFFGLAKQIDWRRLARRMILRLAAQKDYRVEGVDSGTTNSIYRAIAHANGLEPQTVLQGIRPEIENTVLKNPEMAKDFRQAMSSLCECEHVPDQHVYSGQPFLDWLTGPTRVSSVRSFSIYTAINRTTARHFIESTLCWVRRVGHAGTVLLLDNSRVTLSRNPRDGQRYYTRAMATDHYELLREFIDGVDRLSGMLLLVVASYEFLDETSSRGYGIYNALRTRIMDDVRDRNLVNPVASLVRLSQGDVQHDGMA